MNSNIPKPKVKIENGYSVGKVRINSKGGTSFSGLGKIYKECNAYPKAVLFKKPDAKKEYSGKSMIMLLTMNMVEGSKIIVSVEGKDSNAKRLALRICSILSSG